MPGTCHQHDPDRIVIRSAVMAERSARMTATAPVLGSMRTPRRPKFGRRSPLAWWFALVTRRHVRGQMVALTGLMLILAAGVTLLLAGGSADRRVSLTPADMLRPVSLPAAPVVGTDAVDPAPLLGQEAASRNAEAPFVALGPAARPFVFKGPAPDRDRARACLAAAMLYEAGDDPVGQLAVGQVVLNRMRHPAFPASVCGVVTQGHERATGCQFSFTCDGSLSRLRTAAARAKAMAHADLMLSGFVFPQVGLATHYHTASVYPWWSPRLEKIARVGAHLFFRWPGYWGSASASLRRGGGAEPPAALFGQFAPVAENGVDLGQRQGSTSPAEESATVQSAMLPTGTSPGARAAITDPVAAVPLARRLPQGPPIGADQGMPAPAVSVVGGHRILRAFPEAGVFFLELAPGSTEASRRKVAERLCGGRPACHVYGWMSAAEAPKSVPLDPAARASLAFSFVRSGARKSQPSPPASAGVQTSF